MQIFPMETTWRERAAGIIADVTRELPTELPLQERMKVLDDARPYWGGASWPQKAWQAARRDYLVPFGYRPRTKKHREREASAVAELPLFESS